MDRFIDRHTFGPTFASEYQIKEKFETIIEVKVV